MNRRFVVGFGLLLATSACAADTVVLYSDTFDQDITGWTPTDQNMGTARWNAELGFPDAGSIEIEGPEPDSVGEFASQCIDVPASRFSGFVIRNRSLEGAPGCLGPPFLWTEPGCQGTANRATGPNVTGGPDWREAVLRVEDNRFQSLRVGLTSAGFFACHFDSIVVEGILNRPVEVPVNDRWVLVGLAAMLLTLGGLFLRRRKRRI